MNPDESDLRILHLEDNPFDAELVEVRLKKLAIPYTIRRAENECAFLEALEQETFDVVLSDSKLPALDTSRMLALVRETRPGLPFIFLSGNTSPQLKTDALARGAAAFVSKDEMEQLIPTIQRACPGKVIREK